MEDTVWGFTTKDKTKNAYMLVYERREKQGHTPSVPSSMPEFVRESVVKDNKNFLFERSLYSGECFEFIHGLLNTAVALGTDLSGFGVDFVMKVVAHSFQNKLMPELITVLLQLFTAHPDSCKAFVRCLVTQDVQTLCETLLVCSEFSTRTAFKDLYVGTVTLCLQQGSNEEFEMLVDTLLSFVPHELGKHWVRFQQYWELFKALAELGPQQCLFLQSRGFVAKCTDFYLGKLSPLHKPGDARPTIGNSLCSPTFDALIQTLSLIASHCSTDIKTGLTDLSPEDRQCLLANEFFDKAVRHGHDCVALGQVISHWSWENPAFTKRIAQVLLKGLNKIDHDQLKGYYDVLHAFFAIEDSLVRSRVEWLLGFPSLASERWGADYLHSFGYGIRHSVEDDALVYMTTVSFGTSVYDTAESVLALVWKQRKRWDHSCILNIKHLLEVALANQELGQYLAQMPAASYQYGSLINWVSRYIEDFKRTSHSTSSYPSKRQQYGAEAESLYMKFIEMFPDSSASRYIIGRSLAKETVRVENQNDVELAVVEYTTKWVPATTELINQLRPHIPVVESRAAGPPLYTPYTPQTIQPVVEFQTNPTVLRFEAHNRTGHATHLELKFNLGPNVMCPSTGVALELGPYAFKELITVGKINPAEDWGQLEFEWTLSEASTFTLMSDTEEYPQESAVYFPTEPISMIEPLDQALTELGTQKNCPACTYLNEPSARSCVVCFTPIPS